MFDRTKTRLANYATGILGKTFTVIQTPDVQPGDLLLDFQTHHIGYEVPKKVKKITKITAEFYDIEFEGHEGKALPRYAHTCLFGRIAVERIENE
jgi:hypothetical protein